MTSEHDKRPRPQYGEYAEPAAGTADAPAASSDSIEPSDTSASAPASPPATTLPAATPSTAPPAPATPSRLPGVPHNLGVKWDGAARPTRAPQLGEPYRAADPAQSANAANPEAAPVQAAAQAAPQAAVKPPARPRAADRIITIALLVLGGYFALSMAFSLAQLPAEFAKIAGDLGIANFAAPPQVQTIGTVGAILVLSLYALVLIFSIRRLRARKLTFWAPLAAGLLAWVLFFVLFAISLGQSTELWQELMQIASDPEKAQQLLDQLSTRS